MLLRDINNVEKSADIIEKVMISLVKREDSSVRLLSFTLKCSHSTISGVIHGQSHNMEHYITLFSYYSRILGWEQDFSRVPEIFEMALSTGDTLVLGLKDKKSGEIKKCVELFWKE